MTLSKPTAVLISDLHFTPSSLELASSALRMAKAHAVELNVPLVVAGDTLDSKDIIRGVCANRLIEIFTEHPKPPETYVLVGNHDMLNEKGTAHSLEFLKTYVNVVDRPTYAQDIEAILLPYYSDAAALSAQLKQTPAGSLIICHQGVQTAYMGHYAQDKSSLPKEAFSDFRTISGHYHRAQEIKCGRPRKVAIGLFSYIGTPYTTSFAEANDGPKGYQILHYNGLMTQIPTNLRKHVIIDTDLEGLKNTSPVNPNDLLWVKVRGSRSELAKIRKKTIGNALIGHENFKLDLIPLDSNDLEVKTESKHPPCEVLDSIIQNTPETDDQKAYLRKLWREVIGETP